MAIAKNHKVLHVVVAVNQALRQICPQKIKSVPPSSIFPFVAHAEQRHLTLDIWAFEWMLPHSQSSIPVRRFLFEKIVHTFVVDLQIAGTKTKMTCLVVMHSENK